MEDSLMVIFTMFVAVIIMFMFPIMDTWERQDDISYMSTYSTVVEFVDSVRNLGYISPDMYFEFTKKIISTGNRYDVTLEHRKRIYDVNGYKNVYTNEIEQKLMAGEDYDDMKAGDFFYVSVKNTNKTQSTLMKEVIYAHEQETFKIGVPYGGMIRNTKSSGT